MNKSSSSDSVADDSDGCERVSLGSELMFVTSVFVSSMSKDLGLDSGIVGGPLAQASSTMTGVTGGEARLVGGPFAQAFATAGAFGPPTSLAKGGELALFFSMC